MRWSEAVPSPAGGGGPLDGALGGVPATPQIKNHSVTHHRGHLYCFGGYDGRRNHQTLLIYSLREGWWLLPSPAGGMINLGDGPSSHFTVRGVPPPGRNGHTATLATGGRRSRRRRHRMNHLIYDEEGDIGLRGEAALPRRNSRDPPSSAEVEVRAALNDLANCQRQGSASPSTPLDLWMVQYLCADLGGFAGFARRACPGIGALRAISASGGAGAPVVVVLDPQYKVDCRPQIL